MEYDFAVKSDKMKLEIRYAIRFNTQAEVQPARSEDPNVRVVTVPRGNLFPALFQTTVLNISGGEDSEVRAFHPSAVMKEFGTEEGAVTTFAPRASGWMGYKKCMMVGLRKDGASEAYVFFLFDDFKKADPLIQSAFHSLRFQESTLGAKDGGE